MQSNESVLGGFLAFVPFVFEKSFKISTFPGVPVMHSMEANICGLFLFLINSASYFPYTWVGGNCNSGFPIRNQGNVL